MWWRTRFTPQTNHSRRRDAAKPKQRARSEDVQKDLPERDVAGPAAQSSPSSRGMKGSSVAPQTKTGLQRTPSNLTASDAGAKESRQPRFSRRNRSAEPPVTNKLLGNAEFERRRGQFEPAKKNQRSAGLSKTSSSTSSLQAPGAGMSVSSSATALPSPGAAGCWVFVEGDPSALASKGYSTIAPQTLAESTSEIQNLSRHPDLVEMNAKPAPMPNQSDTAGPHNPAREASSRQGEHLSMSCSTDKLPIATSSKRSSGDSPSKRSVDSPSKKTADSPASVHTFAEANSPLSPQFGSITNEQLADQAQFAHLPPLPEGWMRVRSRTSGDVYYCYTPTGETTFREPGGWVEVVSKSTGRTYYWNASLGKSQFERPPEMGNPPKKSQTDRPVDRSSTETNGAAPTSEQPTSEGGNLQRRVSTCSSVDVETQTRSADNTNGGVNTTAELDVQSELDMPLESIGPRTLPGETPRDAARRRKLEQADKEFARVIEATSPRSAMQHMQPRNLMTPSNEVHMDDFFVDTTTRPSPRGLRPAASPWTIEGDFTSLQSPQSPPPWSFNNEASSGRCTPRRSCDDEPSQSKPPGHSPREAPQMQIASPPATRPMTSPSAHAWAGRASELRPCDLAESPRDVARRRANAADMRPRATTDSCMATPGSSRSFLHWGPAELAESPREAMRRRKLEAADRELEQLKEQQQVVGLSARDVAQKLRKSHSRCFMTPFANDRGQDDSPDRGRRRCTTSNF